MKIKYNKTIERVKILVKKKHPLAYSGFFYTKGGQTSRTKGRVGKKFETEDRTDWKSKVKKIITTADVLFSAQN